MNYVAVAALLAALCENRAEADAVYGLIKTEPIPTSWWQAWDVVEHARDQLRAARA